MSDGRKCLTYVKQNLEIEVDVVVSECTACYRVVAVYVTILHLISEDVLTPKISR